MEISEFKGKIGRDWRDSEPWWPEPVRPPAGAPNVCLIVLDDVGFAQLGCYGSDISTPTLDRLAANGLRYTSFHTTALCSPTRACLMTGRNHHSVGMGRITDLARGFPGYSGSIPASCGFLPEMLREAGYATYAVGKWHLTPEQEAHLAAPRTKWPLGRGFERYYGYFGGETHQYSPALVDDNHFVEAPYSDDYHLTEDLADHAVGFLNDLRAVDPEKPFFLYFCTGACHSPHQAPADWIERYKGHFDAGWDAWREATFARQVASGIVPEGTELSPRPPWVPAWDAVPEEERPLAIRFMECFAGFLSHADAQIGRVIAFLEELGELDNTLVVAVSDNGASSEGGRHGSINDVRLWNQNVAGVKEMLGRIDEFGGPTIHNNYPWGWTMAGNTPLRRWKRETHEGGIADPCLVHWPSQIRARGEIRRQFVHAIDVAPTILDVCRIEPPSVIAGVEQRPLEGASFAATFGDAAAPTRDTQYFEMLGSRAIYHDGWKAVTFKPLGVASYLPDDDPNLPFDEDVWELYHVADDFSECHDRAVDEPGRVKELVDLWWEQAEKYQVLPLDNRPYVAIMEPPPTGLPARSRFVYRPGGSRVPEEVAADVKGRSHTIVADVHIPDGGAEGALLAMGSILGGYSLFVADGRLQYVHNYLGQAEHRLSSDRPLTPGRHQLGFEFKSEGRFKGGTARLTVDGVTAGEGVIPRFTPVRFSITDAGLSCGEDSGSAVTRRYRAPFRFTGVVERVVVEVEGEAVVDPDAAVEARLRTQ